MSRPPVTARGSGRALEIAPGVRLPLLGLGVWELVEAEAGERAILSALEAGYRHIDTAQGYENEATVGAAVRASGIPRDEIFVTTKFHPSRPDAELEAERSLERLGLDYVDLYLVHDPRTNPVWAWPKMERALARGLTRSIGVSNFAPDDLDALLAIAEVATRGQPAPAQPLRLPAGAGRGLRERGIAVEAYSPLDARAGTSTTPDRARAERLGRTPAQVMLRWGIERGFVVLPKSNHRERQVENAAIFDFALGDDRSRGARRTRPHGRHRARRTSSPGGSSAGSTPPAGRRAQRDPPRSRARAVRRSRSRCRRAARGRCVVRIQREELERPARRLLDQLRRRRTPSGELEQHPEPAEIPTGMSAGATPRASRQAVATSAVARAHPADVALVGARVEQTAERDLIQRRHVDVLAGAQARDRSSRRGGTTASPGADPVRASCWRCRRRRPGRERAPATPRPAGGHSGARRRSRPRGSARPSPRPGDRRGPPVGVQHTPVGNWWAGESTAASPAAASSRSVRAPRASTGSGTSASPADSATARCCGTHGSSMASLRAPAREGARDERRPCRKPPQTTTSSGSARTPRARERYEASCSRRSLRPRGSP